MRLFTVNVHHSDGTVRVYYYRTEREQAAYFRTYSIYMEMFSPIVTAVTTGVIAVSVDEQYRLLGIDPETRDVRIG